MIKWCGKIIAWCGRICLKTNTSKTKVMDSSRNKSGDSLIGQDNVEEGDEFTSLGKAVSQKINKTKRTPKAEYCEPKRLL